MQQNISAYQFLNRRAEKGKNHLFYQLLDITNVIKEKIVMGTFIVICILILIIILALLSIRKRILYGSACCGGHDAPPAKIRVHDKNKSHYPYTYVLSVDGMHCSNCSRRIENALNIMNGVWAKADLETKKVTVRSKTELNAEEISAKINEAGYTVLEIL